MRFFSCRQGTFPRLLASPLRTSPTSTALFVLLAITALTSTALAAVQNDFSSYPQGAQPCLYSSATSSACTGNTGTEMNQCLCRNQGNFVYNTATCVAKASPADLDSVYATLVNNCQGTGVILAVGKDAFMAAAAAATQGGAESSSATATATSETATSATSTMATQTSESSTATSTPSQDDDGSNSSSSSNSLSTGTKIGVGVGVGFGAIALGLAAWFIYAYSRRRDGGKAAVAGDDSPSPSTGYGTPSGVPQASELDDSTNRYWPHAHHPMHAPPSSTFSPATPVSASSVGGLHESGGKPAVEPIELGTGPWTLAPTNQPLLAELPSDTGYHGGAGGSSGHGGNYHEYAPSDSHGTAAYSPSVATYGHHSHVSPQTATGTMSPHDENGTWKSDFSFTSSHQGDAPPRY
ncbi:hypothetical protein Micbo1qcDRAFT_156424 [Microdochium bolleyi]|uniref:Extracellular membrane protein CFEM domain-containing protein n=1 Tax=Microdochium bolleyi TaxID=196109 RepID=A0A136JK49_9PEZI|nr:hypothetical protein Micbo1qcDRAFT_156424 [Microdochium bolleyi]